MRSSRLSAKDRARTVESSLAVANHSSSGEKLRPRTASRSAGHAVRLFMLGWKYLTIPDWSADAVQIPAWFKVSARIAVSCVWRMVSKLNVNRFQAVNSPPQNRSVYCTTTLRCPLGATSGWEKTDDTRTKCTNCDGIHWTSNFVRRCVDEFCAEQRRGVVRVGFRK